MASTNDGFIIAEKILNCGARRYRGYPAKRMLSFKLANIVQDRTVLKAARDAVEDLLNNDPTLLFPKTCRSGNTCSNEKDKTRWARIA